MTEDPRMRLKTSGTIKREGEHHEYKVMVRESLADAFVETTHKSRHEALQRYVNARIRLSDHAQEPENFLCRIWCDGKEYFNEPTYWPPGPQKGRGVSPRMLNGTERPFYFERRLP